ncbi:MAG: PTS lactose/cellobiose transporter subunit IIA [Coriobacteriia bacterium]|nr:PTS lactose/cellobiose transporter subunit IIA [Coriobacteriia bacterium]
MAEETFDIPTIAMGVILNAGDARVFIDKAMDALAELDLEAAESFLDEADKKILAAHRSQTDMIQREASGETMEFSVLFVHAQDTLMTIAAELHMAKKMLPVVKALAARK